MFAGHIALQLVDLRMEHQANRFMGCDYNIELLFKGNTAKVALSTLFTGIEQSWNLYSSI